MPSSYSFKLLPKCRRRERAAVVVDRPHRLVVPSAPMMIGYADDDAWTMSSAAVSVAGVETHRIKCYTPADTVGHTAVSCITEQNGEAATLTTDKRLVVIPVDAIVDRVEFFGRDDFSVKERFYIGLGQLNDTITFPVIVGATSEIANEKIGGCFDFIGTDPSGASNKNVVLYDSFVNVNFDHALSRGSLIVFVTYHMRS